MKKNTAYIFAFVILLSFMTACGKETGSDTNIADKEYSDKYITESDESDKNIPEAYDPYTDNNYSYGMFCLENGDYLGAIESMKKVDAFSPAYKQAADAKNQAEELYVKQIIDETDIGDYENSLIVIDGALDMFPDNPLLTNRRSEIIERNSADLIERAVYKGRNDPLGALQLLNNSGLADYSQAISDKMTDISKQYNQSLVDSANEYLEAHDYDSALAVLDSADADFADYSIIDETKALIEASRPVGVESIPIFNPKGFFTFAPILSNWMFEEDYTRIDFEESGSMFGLERIPEIMSKPDNESAVITDTYGNEYHCNRTFVLRRLMYASVSKGMTHYDGNIDMALQGSYKTVTGTIASYSKDCRGDADFVVYADDVEIFREKVINSTAPFDITLSVECVNMLTFKYEGYEGDAFSSAVIMHNIQFHSQS